MSETISRQDLQTLAGMSTKFDTSGYLETIIINTGGLITQTGLPQSTFDDIDSQRACRTVVNVRKPGWRGWFGATEVDPEIIGTSVDVIGGINTIKRHDQIERFPEPCGRCGRGSNILDTLDRAICPMAKLFAKSLLERARAFDRSISERLKYSIPFSGIVEAGININGSSRGLPIPEIFYGVAEQMTKAQTEQVRQSQEQKLVAQLKGNITVVEDSSSILQSIEGYRVGRLLLVRRLSQSAQNSLHADPNILSLGRIPFEFTNQHNGAFSLQTLQLIDETIDLSMNGVDENEHILDIGAGEGIASLLLAHRHNNRRATITMVELDSDRLAGASSIQRMNGIHGAINTVNARIQGYEAVKPVTHLIANFGRHYEDGSGGNSPHEAIIRQIESNSLTLKYVVLGGYQQNDKTRTLTSEDLARIQRTGLKLKAVSKYQADSGELRLAYAFTK